MNLRIDVRPGSLMLVFVALLLTPNCGGAVTVSEADAKRLAIDKPAPVISQLARQLKLSGRIELAVTISATGAVETVKPLTGNPLLLESGVAAAKKWRFKPFVENGSPAQAITTLTFEFRQ